MVADVRIKVAAAARRERTIDLVTAKRLRDGGH